MEVSEQPHYSVHPVDYDADIRCERCNREHATHYVRGPEGGELCDQCVVEVVTKLQTSTHWALFE